MVHFLCSFVFAAKGILSRINSLAATLVSSIPLSLYRYTKSARFKKMGYEEDFFRYLQSLVGDCERRIKRGHQRLALSNSQGSVSRFVPLFPTKC